MNSLYMKLSQTFPSGPKYRLWFGFIECFSTTFLHTHHSLLAKLGRVRANDLIPNFAIVGNCGLGKVQVRHALRHLAGVKSQPGGAYNQVFYFGAPRPN